MRTPTGARISRAACRSLLLLGLLSGTGCATLRATFAGYATGRDGITARIRSSQRRAVFVSSRAAARMKRARLTRHWMVARNQRVMRALLRR